MVGQAMKGFSKAWYVHKPSHTTLVQGYSVSSRKLSSIEDQGQADRVTALPRLYALDINL